MFRLYQIIIENGKIFEKEIDATPFLGKVMYKIEKWCNEHWKRWEIVRDRTVFGCHAVNIETGDALIIR